jgi:hypothetical protein
MTVDTVATFPRQDKALHDRLTKALDWPMAILALSSFPPRPLASERSG